MNIFSSQKSEMLSHFFGTQNMIKNLIFNKTKNISVRFFTDMSSRGVQLFTAFEEVVLKLYGTLVSALRSNMAVISMETNRGNDFFSPYFFILILINIQ